MNDMLQEKIAEVLELGKQGALQAADILKAEMPELCEQVLKYNFVMSTIPWIIFPICATLACTFYAKEFQKIESDDYYDFFDDILPYGLPAIVFSILSLGFFIGMFDNTAWIKILLAPKLYLVDYVISMLK